MFERIDSEESRVRIKLMLNSNSDSINNDIIIEECAELIKTITKSNRGKTNRDNIKEEMIDVLICLQMCRDMYKFTDEELIEEYEKKMKRNIDRIP